MKKLLLILLFPVFVYGQQLSNAFQDSIVVGDSAGTVISIDNGTVPMGITTNDNLSTNLQVEFYISKYSDSSGFWNDAYLLCNPDNGNDVYIATLVPYRLIPLWYDAFRVMTKSTTGGYVNMYIRMVVVGGVSQKLHLRLITKNAAY